MKKGSLHDHQVTLPFLFCKTCLAPTGQRQIIRADRLGIDNLRYKRMVYQGGRPEMGGSMCWTKASNARHGG